MSDSQEFEVVPERFALPSALLHDLRTLVGHITGYSEMILDEASSGTPDQLVPDLKKVRLAGQDLLTLINNSFLSSGVLESADGLPTLSQAAVPVESLTDSDAEPEAWEDAASSKLLVVDDNASNREILLHMLRRQGYNVSTAENGWQALEKLQEDTFELVLLDIMMPGMDGYEVLKRLKDDEELRHIPVVMLSAFSEIDSVARCIKMGAEDYLPKPFNPTLLKARITASLEKKHARDLERSHVEELQRSYQRLQELEKQRDDLTHMIIHDLRTPLTSLITGLHSLDAVGELNVVQQEMKGIALAGGESLLEMINELLDVEKMESGAMLLNEDTITVDHLVNAAVAQVTSLLELNQLNIVQQIAVGVPMLLGDEGKLRRTLVNLLGNAIKFTPAMGTVTVAVQQREGEAFVEFSVTDTGEGIPPESFGEIFEKFGQVESRQSGRTMSTGLGLTFCKLTVEAHGGHIQVESSPGLGSTFSFTIPCNPTHRLF